MLTPVRILHVGPIFLDYSWEPIENMEGSEETVTRFWERINTNGRDHRDLRQFKAGEVFLPIGPPKSTP